MKKWLSKLVSLAKRGYKAYRDIPEDDRDKIEDAAKKAFKQIKK